MKKGTELKRLGRFNAMLSGVIAAIIHVKNRDDFFDHICKIAVEEGGYKMAWIGIVETDTQMVKPVSFAGFEEGYLNTIRVSIDASVPEGRGPTGTALREGRYLISEDIEQARVMSPWRQEALKRGYRSSAAFPLIVEGKTEGSLNLYSSIPNFFDDNEVSLLNDLSCDISFALEILKREQKLKEAHVELMKAKEAAETANRAKSNFLSRMSHDLRTPLNSIVGFAQVLSKEKEKFSEREKLCIGEIEAAGWHLTSLIDEILDIASIEAAHMQLDMEELEICPIAEECLSLMIPIAEKKELTFSFDPGEFSHAIIRADKTRLKEVILNLLTNAIKYNVHSGFVSLKCKGVKKGKLRICITNSGPIIPVKEKEHIFEPFNRIEGMDAALQGMGLGLSISKRLMNLMKGNIGLEKSSSEGNTFYIEIPVVTIEKKKKDKNTS